MITTCRILKKRKRKIFFLKLQDRIEHAQRFDETFLPRAPLAQLLESDKAVLVHIDFLSRRRRRRQLTSDPTRITRARTSFHHQIALQPTTRRCVRSDIYRPTPSDPGGIPQRVCTQQLLFSNSNCAQQVYARSSYFSSLADYIRTELLGSFIKFSHENWELGQIGGSLFTIASNVS